MSIESTQQAYGAEKVMFSMDALHGEVGATIPEGVDPSYVAGLLGKLGVPEVTFGEDGRYASGSYDGTPQSVHQAYCALVDGGLGQ